MEPKPEILEEIGDLLRDARLAARMTQERRTIMAATFNQPRDIQAVDIYLQSQKIGTIVRTPGDFNAFSFEDSYRAADGLPILSLSFRSASGGLRKNPRPLAGALPPFFANLLPEEKLREAMERHHAGEVRPGNDFDLLAALGADLPGAVRVLTSSSHPSQRRQARKFAFH